MQIGDKVVCISISNTELLVLNDVYEVLENSKNGIKIKIGRYTRYYPKCNFKTVSEYRDEIIDKLIYK